MKLIPLFLALCSVANAARYVESFDTTPPGYYKTLAVQLGETTVTLSGVSAKGLGGQFSVIPTTGFPHGFAGMALSNRGPGKSSAAIHATFDPPIVGIMVYATGAPYVSCTTTDGQTFNFGPGPLPSRAMVATGFGYADGIESCTFSGGVFDLLTVDQAE